MEAKRTEGEEPQKPFDLFIDHAATSAPDRQSRTGMGGEAPE
jgi:hypothetical protein